MIKISKKTILFILTGMLCIVNAQEQSLSDTKIEDLSSSIIGQWVKEGQAIKEYPVCYQLWRCESSKPAIGESINLPKGEWGLCDNYADYSKNNFCNQCEAPSPIEACE